MSPNNADARTTALALLNAGLTPLPTHPDKKSPAIKWTEYGDRRPTREEVGGWYAADSRRGVALMMGPTRLAVDVDTKSGGDPVPFFGTTPAVQYTPNGGFHFLYSLTASEHAKPRVGVRQGIDIRAGKSIIVVAPTAIPAADGEVRAYRFEVGGFDALLAGNLPDAMSVPAVRALLEEKPASAGDKASDEPAEPWIADTLARPEGVRPGGQEQVLTRLCFWAARQIANRALPYDIALAILTRWASHLPLSDPAWPWDQEHVVSRLDRALEKVAPDPGYVSGVEGAQREQGEPLRFISYDELADKVRESSKRPWLVPGWLRARGLFLIAGASHFGKTWLSIDLAASAAIGGRFLNQYAVDPGESEGRRVLYIVGEDDAPDFMERLDAVLAAKDAMPVTFLEGDTEGEARSRAAQARHELFRSNFRVHIDRQFLFGDETAQTALLGIVKEFKPSLVILDPLKDMVPGEEVEKFFARGAEYTRFLRDLRDAADCCVGIVHHTTKSLDWEKPDAGISGRTEFIASFEHRFVCFRAPVGTDDGEPVRWSRGVIQRRIKSSSPLDPVAVRYAGLGEELILLADEVSEGDGRWIIEGTGDDRLELRVLDAVREHGPISGNDLAALLGGRRKDALQAVKRLAAARRIVLSGPGYVVPGVVPVVPSRIQEREPQEAETTRESDLEKEAVPKSMKVPEPPLGGPPTKLHGARRRGQGVAARRSA